MADVAIEPRIVPRDDSPVDLDTKVAFLERRSSYPDRPRRVDAVETHMSWVFLTDERAYKLKKPVLYSFLDFANLDARKLNCDEEVRLNRRLAPGVYKHTVALTLDDKNRLQIGGDGEVADYLVEMRRLPSDLMLDYLVRTGAIDEITIHRLARVLARFYSRARPVSITAEKYRRRFAAEVKAILAELGGHSDLPRDLVTAVGAELLRFLHRQERLFDHRVELGKIVEGHGDLRPEHICLEDEPLVIDVLEFQRDLRLVDPADELAYLAMECARLGAPWIGNVIFATYGEEAGDYPPAALVTFYEGFRAFLRAKLAYWHTLDPQVEEPARWLELTRGYLQLAAESLLATPPQRVG